MPHPLADSDLPPARERTGKMQRWDQALAGRDEEAVARVVRASELDRGNTVVLRDLVVVLSRLERTGVAEPLRALLEETLATPGRPR
jgi:hypothetical protein